MKMKTISQEILNFHCPRWNELPDLDLYMDQLVSILEKNLIIFEELWGEKIITSMMINNYVKQKVVDPPIKKRYNREHLAYFFVVCIMKRVLSISEISDLISYLTSLHSIDYAYNLYCDELERAIKEVFAAKLDPRKMKEPDKELIILRSAILAFANKMYFQVGIKNRLQ